jgi:hypothetical protein
MMKTVKILLIAVVLIIGQGVHAQTLNPTYSISTAGTADSFKGGYTFAYPTSGSPWSGAFMSFGGALNNYDCQLNALYGAGGNHISFRTHNGDSSTWNPWFEIWHSGNLNRANVDFTARTITSTSVYNNGNLWSKQINVALTNPWPDYVFQPEYHLPLLADVKAYIDQNRHLPDMPSEQEVVKNGQNLGELNILLTKKVEELTLYLIGQETRAKQQEIRIASQEERINRLENIF